MKQRRQELKISQSDLAEMACVGIATIKDIERGAGNPSLKMMEKIADVLGMEIDIHIKKNS
ncbi:MAG: helix-turn-helix transcriptional regulator [Paludibacteraceae bacterium]|nr:helix-turn-helix transcriptional regulator [Paludibacteraceae bacterium]